MIHLPDWLSLLLIPSVFIGGWVVLGYIFYKALTVKVTGQGVEDEKAPKL